MKASKILRDCRLRGEDVAVAMHGIGRLHNHARTAWPTDTDRGLILWC
jgi:hypothetical protein